MQARERRHSDALPEAVDFRDDGCSVAPRCLARPLPQCRYDVRGGARIILNAVRDPEISRLYEAGSTIDEIAVRFGISRRSVFRVLRKERGAP